MLHDILKYPKGYPNLISAFSDRLWCRIQLGLKKNIAKAEIADIYVKLLRPPNLVRVSYFPPVSLFRNIFPPDELGSSMLTSRKVNLEILEPPANNSDIDSINEFRNPLLEKGAPLSLRDSHPIGVIPFTSEFIPEEDRINADRFGEAIIKIPTLKEQYKYIDRLYSKYDALCKKEYDSIKVHHGKIYDKIAKKKRFDSSLSYYKWLRKYYFYKGITDPPAHINRIKKNVKFLGLRVTGGAVNELVTILQNTERYLLEMDPPGAEPGTVRKKIMESFTWPAHGGFMPRTLNDGSSLSPHALGRAIDIAAPFNPHLKGKKATIINKIIQLGDPGSNLTVEGSVSVKMTFIDNSQEDLNRITVAYQRMQIISNHVQNFLIDWLSKWTNDKGMPEANEEEMTLQMQAYILMTEFLLAFGVIRIKNGKIVLENGHVKTSIKNRERVLSFMKNGIVTIPLELFIALKRAGAITGIEFNTSKDTMHFNVNPSYPKSVLPTCVKELREKNKKKRRKR